MQHRLYFLLPDVASARRVMNDLLLARITERSRRELRLEAGQPLWAQIKAVALLA